MTNRTQHRHRWRGKRMSTRVRELPQRDNPFASAFDRAIAGMMSEAIAKLWRQGKW